MPQLQLNKPLYKDTAPAGASSGKGVALTPAQQLPRPAKPAMWMRLAALAIDLLLLHGVMLVTLKLMFAPIVGLGMFGPFVGLGVAILYFTIGSSLLTQGRTMGRLVMRLQVADARRGTDLPVPRAFARSLMLGWALVAFAVVSLQVERMADPLKLDPQLIILQMAGFAVAAAWYLGNFFHAWFDPYGRSLIDHKVGSVTFSSDAAPEDVQAFLRTVREKPFPEETRRAKNGFTAAVLTVLSLAIGLSWFSHHQFTQLPEEIRAEALEQRRNLAVTGFQLPIERRLDAADAATARAGSDDGTTAPQGIQIQYWKRGAFTAEDVKANPSAGLALDKVTSTVARDIVKNMNSLPPEQLAKLGPEKAKIQVAFAQYGDLFFATQATNVYSESQLLDLAPFLPGTTQATTATATNDSDRVTTR